MIKIFDIKLPIDFDFQSLKNYIAELLGTPKDNIVKVTLHKKSIDARKKDNIIFICTVLTEVKDDESNLIKKSKQFEAYDKYIYVLPELKRDKKRPRPIVIGAGPAGLFAALTLAEAGLCPLLFERGKDADSRTEDVKSFWSGGELDEQSNVQFGEGGAGTFSDGKLNTGTKDRRIRRVLDCFFECGAPEEILYEAKPHIGTDKLKEVVKNLRKRIISLGGEVKFSNRLSKINIKDNKIISVAVQSPNGEEIYDCDTLILAVGHSARDTFESLYESGVPINQKPFAMGVRIEHTQEFINKSQYGKKFYNHKALGAADYRLAVHLQGGRSVFTFCMCPGGEVVAAASEKNSVVTNGMSYFARDGRNANSALLVGVSTEDFKNDHPLAGVEFQRQIERKAFEVSNSYKAPAQTVGDFLAGIKSSKFSEVMPTYKPGVSMCDLNKVLPEFMTNSLKQGLKLMDNKIKGFCDKNAVLTAPETRSSSPVRILRGENLQSDVKGLYPCGEGAGYAGGIMSAAVDGIRCAEAIIEE